MTTSCTQCVRKHSSPLPLYAMCTQRQQPSLRSVYVQTEPPCTQCVRTYGSPLYAVCTYRRQYVFGSPFCKNVIVCLSLSLSFCVRHLVFLRCDVFPQYSFNKLSCDSICDFFLMWKLKLVEDVEIHIHQFVLAALQIEHREPFIYVQLKIPIPQTA